MPAVTFRAASTATTTHNGVNGASLVINKPTGVVDGDFMLMGVEFFNVSGTGTITVTGGWTLLDSFNGYLAVYYKTASSEPSSYTVSIPAGQTIYDTTASISAYSNVYLFAEYGFNGGAGATSPAFTNLGTTIGPNDMVVGLWMEYQNSHTQATLTAPAGTTQRVNVKSTHTSGFNNGIISADKLNAQNPGNATSSVAIEGGWDCYTLGLIAIQPPTANAGTDRSVFSGSNVTLSGSGADPEGGALTYAWTVTSDGGTGLTTGMLTGATTTTPSFTAPSVVANSNIVLTLTVTDNQALTGTDTVTVQVKPVNVLISATGAGGIVLGGPATVSARLINILVAKTGAGGALLGGAADIDPSIINILVAATGSGGARWGGEADWEFVVVTVQPPQVFSPTPIFEVSLAARTPSATGAPALAEIERLVVDSISYTDELNRPGTATLGCPVRALTEAVKFRLADLAAHPCEAWIYYDSELVWAGEVQTIAIQDQIAQLTCVGLLGYTQRMGVISDQLFTGVDQFEIATTLIDQWQDLAYGNYGIDTSGIGTSGVVRDRTYLAVELNNVGQRLEELAAVLNGFDMHVEPDTRELVLSYPKRGVDRTATVVLDDRSIDSAQIMVSIAPQDLASDVYANGTSQSSGGEGIAIATTRGTPALRATYGRSWAGVSFDGVEIQETLEDHADEFLATRAHQLLQPGATLFARPGTKPGQFAPGDLVAYSFDAGLGLQSGTYRVAKVTVAVDVGGALRLTVEFT